MKKMTTDHLAIAAFRPKTLVTVLAFPEGSYKFPRTESVAGNPHARKLLFSKFKLVSKLSEIKSKMQKNRIYDGFDIDVHMNSHKTLEITLVMRNKKNESSESIPNVVISQSDDKQERREVISIVKKAIKAKVNVDYESYRSVPLKNGVSVIFFNYVHITQSCYQLAKAIERQLHYYDVKCFFNGDGLVVNCTKHETHNLDVPFGLKTIPTTVVQSIEKTIVEPVVEIIAPPVEQPVVETVVEYLSLSEQINKTIKQLLANGLSIRDIKNQLGCSDAEMLELLDINNTTVFKHVEKLAKWNNTNFVI
jgi:hypothetical protein